MPASKPAYSLGEVLSGNFEAACVAADGTRYLWHEGYGLRIDHRTGSTVLVLDPATLPDGPWQATRFGEDEIDHPLEPAEPVRRPWAWSRRAS